VGPIDAIRVLRLDAGLFTSNAPPCPAMGALVIVDGEELMWGDVNCSGEANPVDSVLVLRYDAGLSANTGPGCPDLNEDL
jgi:hypothetical protein